MRISDQVCREIAAQLRALEPWIHFGTGEPITREEVEDVLGFEYSIGDSYDAAGIRRLADLIDRPIGIATKAADGYTVCHTCGANFIVSVPVAFRCAEETEADYCPCCGTPFEWRYEDD